MATKKLTEPRDITNTNLFWVTLFALAVAVPLLNYWNLPLNLILIAVFVMVLSLWIFSKRSNIRAKKIKSSHTHTAHLRNGTTGDFNIDVLHPGTPSIAGLSVTQRAHQKKAAKKPKHA
jgi:hypothetical protein